MFDTPMSQNKQTTTKRQTVIRASSRSNYNRLTDGDRAIFAFHYNDALSIVLYQSNVLGWTAYLRFGLAGIVLHSDDTIGQNMFRTGTMTLKQFLPHAQAWIAKHYDHHN